MEGRIQNNKASLLALFTQKGAVTEASKGKGLFQTLFLQMFKEDGGVSLLKGEAGNARSVLLKEKESVGGVSGGDSLLKGEAGNARSVLLKEKESVGGVSGFAPEDAEAVAGLQQPLLKNSAFAVTAEKDMAFDAPKQGGEKPTLVESRHLPLSSKDVKLVSPMNRGEVSTLAANRSAVGPGALSMHESEEKAEFAYSKAYTDEAVGNAAQKKALPKIDKGLVQATGLDGASETKHLVDGNRRKAEIHKAAPQPENERRSFSNASVNTGHDSGKLILPHQMVATGINAAKVAAAQEGTDDGDMDGSPQFAAITAGKGEKEMPRFRMESKTSARDGVPLMKSVPLEHKGGGEGVGDSDQLLLPNQASSTQGMTSGVEKGTFRAFAAQVPQPLTLPMVHHEVSLAIQDGKQHLEIKLHPKELGKIDIRIDSDPLKKIHIHAVFDNPVARQAFEQQLPQLRQSLQEQGLNLAGFDLSDHGRDFQGEQQQQGEFVEAAAADALARSGNAADLEKRSDASGPSGLSIRV